MCLSALGYPITLITSVSEVSSLLQKKKINV